MEALKKAERAKQGQGCLDGETAGQARPAERCEDPVLQSEAAPPQTQRNGNEEGFPPLFDTREEIASPELSLLLEPTASSAITESLPNETIFGSLPEPGNAQPEPIFEPALKPVIDSQPQPAPHKAAAQQKAKTVFAAKHTGNNRSLLLGSAAAVLILGTAAFGYYYWQIISGNTVTPPTGLVQQPPVQTLQPAAQALAGADTDIGAASSAPTEGVPILTSLKPGSTPAQNESAAAIPAKEEKPSASSVAGKPAIQIRQGAATSQLNPLLGSAYQAFQSGDVEQAQQQYRKVLQQDPNNRDALLGLAALSLNRKQHDQATAYYARLLELDPVDPDALAGFVGLQGQNDPAQSESRLKSILKQNPQASAPHFALGNLYTQQSRWAEAQQSFFHAYSKSPNNADYAYNLAVSLDFLSQGKLALEYYQRALALAKNSPASFDKASAQNRAQELQAPPSPPKPAVN
ncbi:MAG: tetratricopeptide repeat protein [Betaproteobacteria bacterium]